MGERKKVLYSVVIRLRPFFEYDPFFLSSQRVKLKYVPHITQQRCNDKRTARFHRKGKAGSTIVYTASSAHNDRNDVPVPVLFTL